MKRSARTAVAASMLAVFLSGCSGTWEQATVTISYAPSPVTEDYSFKKFGRMRVEESFRKFSQRYGYKCRSPTKRVEEIRCRGPHDLYLVFRRSVNTAEFTAKFSWADLGGRTHEEFQGHVLQFERELSTAVGKQHVRIEQKDLTM